MQKSDIRSKTNGTLEERVLVRLLPSQVANRWDYYANTISLSIPPNTVRSTAAMVNILKAIMMNKLVCWIYVSDNSMKALITTHVRVDPISKTRDLLIYSFTALDDNISLTDWEFISGKLRSHAKVNKCNAILAYTRNPKVAEFLESKGADISNTLIQMEV